MRELVLQSMYCMDCNNNSENVFPYFIMEEAFVSKKNALVALEKSKIILEKRGELDLLIDGISVQYSLDRISIVDKNIIRLVVYEFLEESLALEIVVSEAVYLSNKFSTSESSKFVHAIVDGVCKIGV